MTNLLTKVGWALRARKENLALDEDLEHLAPDMARALIAAERLANAAAPYAHKTEGLDHGLHVALAAFRAAMEGRTNG